MITVYGIRACDTCRKALKWLDAKGVEHHFHDLRADGLDAERVHSWLASEFADKLVNRRSTTWRGLDDAQRAASGEQLAALLLQHPTLVKRPVFTAGPAATDEVLAVGFDPTALAALLEVAP